MSNWRNRVQQVIESWEQSHPGLPLVHKQAFDEFSEVRNIRNWKEMRDCLDDTFPSAAWIFRGQARALWRLETSLERATEVSLSAFSPKVDGVLVPAMVKWWMYL